MQRMYDLHSIFGVTLAILMLSYNVNGYNGYQSEGGSYCRTRPGGCCDARKDECSVPISSKYSNICTCNLIHLLRL